MRKAISLAAIVLALSSTQLWAQAIKLVHPVYVEHYSTPKVAGTLLLGLRMHRAPGLFNPTDVSLQVDPKLRGHLVCVSIATQDGMYYAENLYRIASDAPVVSTFQTSTQYGSQLRQYPADQVAVNVRATDDCNGAEDGKLLPMQFSGSARDLLLVAYINADPDRLAVELTRSDGVSWNAICGTGTGSRVAFTSTCEFRVPALVNGTYDLLVHLRERTRVRDTHFSVWIP